MIPKIIHYCWFGGNPLPELAMKCIASWKRFFPDYEIKEWNESNFDFQSCEYAREAYEEKKWAFVSDYARFWILYYYGGIYFDTDVEVIKDMNDIIKKGAFMGCESIGTVAPGLGLGVNPGLGLYKEILEMYEEIHFRYENGRINNNTVVDYTTKILKVHGLVNSNEIQEIAGVSVYPPEYFCPMSFHTGEIKVTANTRTIHHYTASWKSKEQFEIENITRKITERFGSKIGSKIAKIIVLPFRLKAKIKQVGLKRALKIALGIK